MHSPIALRERGTFTFDYHLICEIGMQHSAMQCNATVRLTCTISRNRKKESKRTIANTMDLGGKVRDRG